MKSKSNGKEMLHLCRRCKSAAQHWAMVSPDQGLMIRISSWAYPGTFSPCGFHESEDNQQGVERSPVSVYSWSAPDLQWYLTQCSIAFKVKRGLFAVFGFVFVVKIRSGSSLQVSMSGTAVCSVCFVASLGTPMLLLWGQIQSVWAVPRIFCSHLAKQTCECNYRLRGELQCCLKCQIPLKIWTQHSYRLNLLQVVL